MAYLGNTIVNGNLKVLNGLNANSITQNGTAVSLSTHTHNYAGSSSAGGAATSAAKLNTNAGSATQPVYFNNGIPVATTYALNATVPSGAKFTDTTYTANNGVGLSGTTFYNSGVRSIATGSANGTISVNTNGTAADVAVKGLGSAAYTASTAYAAASHEHTYIKSPYQYSNNMLSPSITSETIFGENAAVNKLNCGFMDNHPLWNGFADVIQWTGYCKWGGTQLAAQYNATSNVRLAIRKYTQAGSKWGDWTEILTTGSSLNAAKLTGTIPASCYTNTTYSANNGVGLSGTTFYNSGVRSIATGSTNGTISVNTNGTATNVAVKGLGTAAYANLSSFHKHGSAYPGGGSKPWHLIAEYSQSVSSTQINTGITFYVSEFHAGISYGILNIRVRFEVNGTTPSYFTAAWSLACNINPNHFIVTYKVVDKNVTLKLYCNRTGWSSYAFNKIEEQSWGTEQDIWQCFVSTNTTALDAIPTDETQIPSIISDINNIGPVPSHTHNYAGSSSAGGAATSANKLNTNAGSGTQPVYFSNGVPVATTYALNATVPSGAKFTDTTYTGVNGISLSGTTFSNSGVRSIATGSSNGTISVNTNGTTADVAVKGLGTAAYTASTAYAAAGHNHDGRYIYWGGTASNNSAWSWGTLTVANGYTQHSHLTGDSGCEGGFASKGGQLNMQLDGFFYQREGAKRCLDTADIATGSANGTISVAGTNIAVKGLGTAAYTASTAYAAASHGNHVPATQTANNAVFLRNDNTWQTVTPANIGAALAGHNHDTTYLKLSGGTVNGNIALGNNGHIILSSGIEIY